MTLACLTLPWPPRILWPNGSKGKHWRPISDARNRQKYDTQIAAKERGAVLMPDAVPDAGPLTLHYEFRHPPRAHGYDDDNAIAAMKAARDQIAVLLGVDDKRFRTVVTRGASIKGGAVVVTVSEIPRCGGSEMKNGAAPQRDPKDICKC